jgi:pimeloyl-ACP methyl ester carboxylesterase
MPFFESASHRLYFEDSGGSGPAVLFSHGFLLDHSMWDAQVRALAPAFRCLTWDERGHGMSECLGPFDYYDSAADAIALLDHLGIDKTTLVGMSQGGFLSMRAAWKYPKRVGALVLVDTAAALFPPEVIAAYRATADAWLANGPVGDVATGMAELLFGKAYDASRWLAKWQARPPADTAHAWDTVLGRDEFIHLLPEIRCPSLVIHGSADQAFDLDTARGLQAALANCKGLVVVDGAAHAPNVTHSEPVNRALRAFLEQYA